MTRLVVRVLGAMSSGYSSRSNTATWEPSAWRHVRSIGRRLPKTISAISVTGKAITHESKPRPPCEGQYVRSMPSNEWVCVPDPIAPPKD